MLQKGDKVRVKDYKVDDPYGIGFVEEMARLCGKVVTVADVSPGNPTTYRILEDGEEFNWVIEFFDMSKDEKFEFIYLLLNEVWYSHHENKDFSGILMHNPDMQRKFIRYCDEFMKERELPEFSTLTSWSERRKVINELVKDIKGEKKDQNKEF